MSRSDTTARAIAQCALVAACVAPAPAWAQSQATSTGSVASARFGQRYLTVGWASRPGLIVDPDGAPSAAHRVPALSWAHLVKAGLHHMVHPELAMSMELDLGWQWVDEHTAAPGGAAPGSSALAWQIGMMGRWLPRGDLGGWSAGLGLHLLRAGLEDAPAQSLDVEARTGWVFWRGVRDPRFALVEVGLDAPIVQGLRLPQTFEADPEPAAAQNWSWWRATLAVQLSL